MSSSIVGHKALGDIHCVPSTESMQKNEGGETKGSSKRSIRQTIGQQEGREISHLTQWGRRIDG